MLQHHKGNVTYFIKKQLTPCVLDVELDCFEDFKLKKDFEPIWTIPNYLGKKIIICFMKIRQESAGL